MSDEILLAFSTNLSRARRGVKHCALYSRQPSDINTRRTPMWHTGKRRPTPLNKGQGEGLGAGQGQCESPDLVGPFKREIS